MSFLLSQDIMLEPYYEIYINNKKIPDKYKDYITSIEIEESDTEADIARINVADRDWIFSNDPSLIKGVPIKIKMGFKKLNRWMLIGKVTHIEANFDANGFPNIIIGCSDNSVKLTSAKKTRTWKKVKASDVVSKIAKEYGMKAIITPTKEVHDQISQQNETDAQLIARLADDELYQFYIDENNVLYFVDNLKTKQTNKVLYYGIKDCNIISFTPTYVERTKDVSNSDVDEKTGKVVKQETKTEQPKPSSATHRQPLLGISLKDGSVKVMSRRER